MANKPTKLYIRSSSKGVVIVSLFGYGRDNKRRVSIQHEDNPTNKKNDLATMKTIVRRERYDWEIRH